jgi:putative tricarboxylic transport membrane protein
MLIILMIAYAFCLRPLGFIGSTTAFLVLSSILLGERKYHILIPIAAISTGGIWYLVQNVLGIFMRPWPAFIG